MKVLINTMIRFFCLLMGVSLGVAAIIYFVYLKDAMM